MASNATVALYVELCIGLDNIAFKVLVIALMTCPR